MSKIISFKKVFTSYFVSARKYGGAFVLMFAAYGVATILSSVLTPLVYRRIIDVTADATDRWVTAGELWQSLWWLIGLIVVYQVFYRGGDYLIVVAQSKTMKDLNDRSFHAIARQHYQFFVDRFSGSLVAQARRYARVFEDLCDILVFNFWMPALVLSGVVGTLCIVAPLLGVVFALWIPIYLVLAIWLTKKKLGADMESASNDSLVTAALSDALANVFSIKAFASEDREEAAFESVTDRDERVRRRAWLLNNLLYTVQIVLFAILEIIAMYLVIRLWLEGDVSTGTVALVQVYIGSIFGQLLHFGRSLGKFIKGIADASEMVAVFERRDVEDLGEERLTETGGGSVVFDRVAFRYAGGANVFRNFSLEIRKGERVGIVGVSGSGKSTLTKLLLRFVDPQEGAIRIGGRDIRELSVMEIRRAIAYVPQDTALFHRTLAENIAYGQPDASRADIIVAAKRAHAHEFISALPKGYGTLVGERGVKLSGGERQRVAIARAILKNAPILILDEATSALDTVSEQHIQAALHELMAGRTAIVIAHRLSTVREMDRIVVFDKGVIVEEGSHQALLDKGGVYADFWKRQTSSFVPYLPEDV